MDKTFMFDQTKRPLFDKLVEYSKSNVTAFDVPGHKLGRGIHSDFIDYVGEEIFKMDINSMKAMDNLSNPEGIIKEAEELAADLFDSDQAFFIVNGSTAGVQNMILTAVKPGDKIIIPRNIHKSAINALILSGANPVYVYPEISESIGISIGSTVKENIRTIDENKDAKAILLLNPTYYGFSSDIKQIIDYAHKNNILVLVDESHGTHFYFNDGFPPSSMTLGADMATISVHKTGGSLTQSSILLLNEERISKNKVRSIINISQTSSASYLLLASLDMARYNLANNQKLISNVLELSKYAIKNLDNINGISVVTHMEYNNEKFRKDPSKLLIDISKLGKTGFEIYDLLKTDYNIQLEFGEAYCVLAIISLGDTYETIDILVSALKDVSKRFSKQDVNISIKTNKTHPKVKMSPRDAFYANTEYMDILKTEGKISGDQIMIYPPGIPILVPGEVITKEIIEEYSKLVDFGNQVIGSINNGSIKIKVIKE